MKKKSLKYFLSRLNLSEGNHDYREEGMCVMEAVAYVSGEEHSDHPLCADEQLTSMMVCLNDELYDHDRQKLRPLIPLLIGTRSEHEWENEFLHMKRLELLRETHDDFAWAISTGGDELTDFADYVDRASMNDAGDLYDPFDTKPSLTFDECLQVIARMCAIKPKHPVRTEIVFKDDYEVKLIDKVTKRKQVTA